MNINFGLFPPLTAGEAGPASGKDRGRNKKRRLSARALADLERWLAGRRDDAAA